MKTVCVLLFCLVAFAAANPDLGNIRDVLSGAIARDNVEHIAEAVAEHAGEIHQLEEHVPDVAELENAVKHEISEIAHVPVHRVVVIRGQIPMGGALSPQGPMGGMLNLFQNIEREMSHMGDETFDDDHLRSLAATIFRHAHHIFSSMMSDNQMMLDPTEILSDIESFMPTHCPKKIFIRSKACAEDVKKICHDESLLKCLEEKFDQLSDACKYGDEEQIAKHESKKKDFEVCTADLQTHCKDVRPGGGRLIKCLKDHLAEITPDCKKQIFSHNFGECSDNVSVLCKTVAPGGGRIRNCLLNNFQHLDQKCSDRLTKKVYGKCADDVKTLCMPSIFETKAAYKCLANREGEIKSTKCREVTEAKKPWSLGGDGHDASSHKREFVSATATHSALAGQDSTAANGSNSMSLGVMVALIAVGGCVLIVSGFTLFRYVRRRSQGSGSALPEGYTSLE
eukprot:GFYU01000314.1.p1 GENE.GFYU01000314.1~~GFYU01000314.1.p1  ORF type:complete len:453 (+),score=163.64 GFYU01000314.1:26-1384(+)